MSVDREPKFSQSSGSEGESSGPASPRKGADRHTGLGCQGVCVRSPDKDKGCCDTSRLPVRVSGSGDFLRVENVHSLAAGSDIFLPFRTHEQATDVSMFVSVSELVES